eukprot:TRINITY_DN5492_c0_g2_i1.p1 TRINITY_DN5492_c0_g2~~TRINITY_DN5492_c0_g2_i1.p1  ORF type:complete len:394 (+),score=78.43 TRINITY_DN5492_c0_g2_i1:66-1247(+)
MCIRDRLHVYDSLFKLVISNVSSDALRIDVVMDEDVMAKYFEVSDAGRERAEVDDMVALVEAFDEGDKIEAARVERVRNIITRVNASGGQPAQLPTVSVSNNTIEDHIIQLVGELSSFLTEQGVKNLNSISEATSPFRYIKLNCSSDFQRSSLVYIVENPAKSCFDISVQNFFETFGPNNNKIKARGTAEYPFERTWKEFGLEHARLDYFDKLFLCYHIADTYHLECQEQELDPEDTDRFDENPIARVNIEVGHFLRTFLAIDGYRIPLTVALLHNRKAPVGVRVTTFDVQRNEETGVLLSCRDFLWKKKSTGEPQKKKKRYSAISAAQEDYVIGGLLQSIGFKFLTDNLSVGRRGDALDLRFKNDPRGTRRVDCIENHLNLKNLLLFYNSIQ